MAILTFDPACFIDMVLDEAKDPSYPEALVLGLPKVPKVQLYSFVLQSLFPEDKIWAYPVTCSDYHIVDDDLYSFIDELSDSLLTYLIELGIIVIDGEDLRGFPTEEDDDVLNDNMGLFEDCEPAYFGGMSFIDDEYDAFMKSEQGALDDKKARETEEELLEILREVLSRAAEDSAMKLTGLRRSVKNHDGVF